MKNEPTARYSRLSIAVRPALLLRRLRNGERRSEGGERENSDGSSGTHGEDGGEESDTRKCDDGNGRDEADGEDGRKAMVYMGGRAIAPCSFQSLEAD